MMKHQLGPAALTPKTATPRPRPWWALLRCGRGTAAIEFAVLGGLLSALLVVSGDLGLAYYSNMQVQTSAQVGAQYAAMRGFNSASIQNAVTSATSTTGIIASPAPAQFCGCPGASSLSNATCGTTCPDGAGVGTYVSVSATRVHTVIIPYPWLPPSYAQTATSTVRIR